MMQEIFDGNVTNIVYKTVVNRKPPIMPITGGMGTVIFSNRRYCSCSRRYYADYRLSEKKTCIDRNEYRGGAIRSAPDFVISGKDDR